MLNQITATLLRIGGVLAGIAAGFFVPEAALGEAVAAAGLEAQITPAIARLAAYVVPGLAGFLIGSRLAAIVERGPSVPAGTREQAAESVPRLRRHLVEGAGPAKASSIAHYVEPDLAPTKPVAVSFKELGLDPPSVSDYPPPAGESPCQGDDRAFRNEYDRPESAGSASDEWDDDVVMPRSEPESPARERLVGEFAPSPESVLGAPAAMERPLGLSVEDPGEEAGGSHLPDPSVCEYGPATDADNIAPSGAANPQTLNTNPPVDDRDDWQDTPARAVPASVDTRSVGEDGYSRPSFARPDATAGSDWYDGAGDEEEDAEDDGAGYGSLIDIGLGKNHAPRAAAGQRGEAGLAPALYSASGAGALVPHGKPQDFRLREALAELQRLESVHR